MVYINFYNIPGRMCNHFYLALQAHKLSHQLNEPVKYITNQFCFDKHVDQKMKKFNTYFIEEHPVPGQKVYQNWGRREWEMYHQLFNQDFTEEQVNAFIQDTFLQTDLFNTNDLDNTVAIHVRLGDYMESTISNCFDKKEYITKCINSLDPGIDTIKIFSDTLDVAGKLVESCEMPRKMNIQYSTNTTDIDDFIELATMKNKILWNSTFSYWSAFISNVLYPDTQNRIFSPVKFSSREPDNNHNNPKWNCM